MFVIRCHMADTPLSRRERAPKPALTREGIIEAALTILGEEGLRKVTMRRIAAALDTGPASLYVYVRDTEDLHAQILDALLMPVVSVATRGAWRGRLIRLVTGYASVLFTHPEIARMTMRTHPSGPNYLSLVDTVLGLLQKGGVQDQDAAWAVDILLAYATANAVEHGPGDADSNKADDFSALEAEIATVDPQAYPNVARLGDQLLSGSGGERFRWGLEVLINGVLHTPQPRSGR